MCTLYLVELYKLGIVLIYITQALDGHICLCIALDYAGFRCEHLVLYWVLLTRLTINTFKFALSCINQSLDMYTRLCFELHYSGIRCVHLSVYWIVLLRFWICTFIFIVSYNTQALDMLEVYTCLWVELYTSNSVFRCIELHKSVFRSVHFYLYYELYYPGFWSVYLSVCWVV